MREIKFRAWNVATSTMVDLHKITPLALNMDVNGLFIPFSDGIIPMQYTGLKDKNGKEIYEGDLLKTENEEIFKVFFNSSTASFDIEFEGGDCESLVTENGWDEDLKEYKYEIIGNLHQNPELLKDK